MPRKPKKQKIVEALDAETDRSTDEVPHGVHLVAAHLVDLKNVLEKIADSLEKRNELLREMNGSTEGLRQEVSGDFETRLAALEKHMLEPAPRRPRAPRAEAAPEAAPPPPPPPKKPACEHALEAIEGRPSLVRCGKCNAVLDVPEGQHLVGGALVEKPKAPPAAQVTVAVPKAAQPAAPATLDDVRAAAITFAGKHGKEKLSAVLAKYGADKISSVVPEQRAALVAELAAGV